jgi:GH15 family glucan-1,4-alpha-glucosidase
MKHESGLFAEQTKDARAVDKCSALPVALTHSQELDQISEWKTKKKLSTNGIVFKLYNEL